jgi:hypothetical protein
VAQILLSMFEAVEKSAYMRSVAARAAATIPSRVPSCGRVTRPSLRPSRSHASRITTLLSLDGWRARTVLLPLRCMIASESFLAMRKE